MFLDDRRQPALRPRRDHRARFVVRVGLDGTDPLIWRRLHLPSDLRLGRLHHILQVTMGWTDSHLHHFVAGPGALDWNVRPFGTPYDEEEEEVAGHQEDEVRLDEVLADPGDQLYYEYDFGDSWEHTIRLEKVEPWRDGDPEATCVGGERACPPEDVGGLGGFYEAMEIRAGDTVGKDPGWVEQIRQWLPDGYDPDVFSVERINEALAEAWLPLLDQWHPMIADQLRRAGSSPTSLLRGLLKQALAETGDLTTDQIVESVRGYTVLLRTVGEGITLTAAGYLPPKVVSSLFTELNTAEMWIGKGNREDQTFPVWSLRQSATALGLLRKARGKLTVTRTGRKLADDPVALWRHIATRLPLGRDHERVAGLLALLFTAAGRDWYRESGAAGAMMGELGWEARSGDLANGVYTWSRPTLEVVRSLYLDPTDGASSPEVARALLWRPDPRP